MRHRQTGVIPRLEALVRRNGTQLRNADREREQDTRTHEYHDHADLRKSDQYQARPVQQGTALLAEPVEGGKHTVEAPVETEYPFVLMRHQFIHTCFGFSGFTYWNFSNALAPV